jgi:hypothetical protein
MMNASDNGARGGGRAATRKPVAQTFRSLENLQSCEALFRSVMATRHGIDLDTPEASSVVRQLLFTIMRKISATVEALPPSQVPSLKMMNNATMNAAMERMLERPPPKTQPQTQSQTQPQMPHQGQSLARDTQLYGQRDVFFNDFKPVASAGRSDATPGIVQSYERELQGRTQLPMAPQVLQQMQMQGMQGMQGMQQLQGQSMGQLPTSTVEPLDTTEFSRRLEATLQARATGIVPNGALPPFPQPQPQQQQGGVSPPSDVWSADPGHGAAANVWGNAPSVPGDSLAIARISQQEADAFRALGAMDATPVQAPAAAARAALVMSPPPQQTVVRHLAVSGVDRDYGAYPHRFCFTVREGGQQTVNSLQGGYRDVQWIEATRVVLPMEIVQATGSLVTPKGVYTVGYSFSYPYVSLRIGGYDGVYDGTNEALRKAFCMFVYHRDYKAPNGRGYVVLKPAQADRKTFRSPIAGLGDLALSLHKPNGTLFNNSKDRYVATNLLYDPSGGTSKGPLSTGLQLKVVIGSFFDTNELFIGDSVRITGLDFGPNPDADPAQAVPQQGYVSVLRDFLNRPEGHEVVDIGKPKGYSGSFYNTIMVLVPGVLDEGLGQLIPDRNLTSVVTALSQAPGDGAPLHVAQPGRILNMSLQVTYTLRVGHLVSHLFIPGDGAPAPAPAPAPPLLPGGQKE